MTFLELYAAWRYARKCDMNLTPKQAKEWALLGWVLNETREETHQFALQCARYVIIH